MRVRLECSVERGWSVTEVPMKKVMPEQRPRGGRVSAPQLTGGRIPGRGTAQLDLRQEQPEPQEQEGGLHGWSGGNEEDTGRT